MIQHMEEPRELARLEDTPAYTALLKANLLTTKYRKRSFEEIFTGIDLRANSSKGNDLWQKAYSCYFCPVIGCLIYSLTHNEFFVPAGNVGLLTNNKNEYMFAQPGMHNIQDIWMKHVGTQALPVNNQLRHGNRVILVVEQGYVGLAFDNGQPILFPPGIHVWTSETLTYQKAVALDQTIALLGPYTLLTVDEGYAAVTQNNGKQQILPGGATWLLDHKNWRFQKFLTMKIQTDELAQIQATSADNITMTVTSTVTWRILNPLLAANMAAETMSMQGKSVSADITKLRSDVLKQAIASLASFMGGVNYSDSFHMAAAAQKTIGRTKSGQRPQYEPEPEKVGKSVENPLYDTKRMTNSVAHANDTTNTYGVEILTINILSAVPVDRELTKALACGAVASAQALQAETAATGSAKAMKIEAEAVAEKTTIAANGDAEAELITAKAAAQAVQMVAEGNKKAADLLATSNVAVELAKMDKSVAMIGPNDQFFFAQEPSYLANLVLKGASAPGAKGTKGSLFG